MAFVKQSCYTLYKYVQYGACVGYMKFSRKKVSRESNTVPINILIKILLNIGVTDKSKFHWFI